LVDFTHREIGPAARRHASAVTIGSVYDYQYATTPVADVGAL